MRHVFVAFLVLKLPPGAFRVVLAPLPVVLLEGVP